MSDFSSPFLSNTFVVVGFDSFMTCKWVPLTFFPKGSRPWVFVVQYSWCKGMLKNNSAANDEECHFANMQKGNESPFLATLAFFERRNFFVG
jgi:hypothetical protein